MNIILLLITLFASMIGVISGIGGGIIIKPILDALGTMDSTTISFLSSCTVLVMAISSLLRSRNSAIPLDFSTSVVLAVSAGIGGILGKSAFSLVTQNAVLIQSVMLLGMNVLVFIYVLRKKKIKTLTIQNKPVCFSIGLSLGLLSAFLGIGGGPMNIAVLSYFFSFSPKVTVRNSLFIILISQLASLGTTVLTNTIPVFDILSLLFMCAGAGAGAMIGTTIGKKLNEPQTERVFFYLLIALILLNLFNVMKFSGRIL